MHASKWILHSLWWFISVRIWLNLISISSEFCDGVGVLGRLDGCRDEVGVGLDVGGIPPPNLGNWVPFFFGGECMIPFMWAEYSMLSLVMVLEEETWRPFFYFAYPTKPDTFGVVGKNYITLIICNNSVDFFFESGLTHDPRLGKWLWWPLHQGWAQRVEKAEARTYR